MSDPVLAVTFLTWATLTLLAIYESTRGTHRAALYLALALAAFASMYLQVHGV